MIQNEFGEDLGLGSTVAAEGKDGQVFEECFEMNNGCICCSVRDDLVNTLERIMSKRDKFDYVLVETTGMANPGPIASIFWLDEELESDLYLDAVITLVDAKHVLMHLNDPNSGAFEAAQQIAFADRIIINKMDLIAAEELKTIESRIRQINSVAPIYRTERSEIDLDIILDVKAFSKEKMLELNDSTVEEHSSHACSTDCRDPSHAHSHEDTHSGHAHTRHDSGIGTVAVSDSRPLNQRKVELWLGEMLWDSDAGDNIFRMKGVLNIAQESKMHVLQGVHQLFEITPSQDWGDTKPFSKMVFIGKALDKAALQQGLSACVESES